MRTDLKVLRVKNNLTQQQMADTLGVSISTYNLVETGKRSGSKKLWLNLQTSFNIGDAEIWQMQKLPENN